MDLNVCSPTQFSLSSLSLTSPLYVSGKKVAPLSPNEMSLSDHFLKFKIGDHYFSFFPQQRQQSQTLYEVMWVMKVRTKEIKRRIPIPKGLFLKMALRPSRQFWVGGPS